MIYINELTNKVVNDINEITQLLADCESYEEDKFQAFYVFVIDEPARGMTRIINTYPETGGRDVESVELVPAVGHWAMLDEMGRELNLPIEMDTDKLSKDQPNPAIVTVGRIRPKQ